MAFITHTKTNTVHILNYSEFCYCCNFHCKHNHFVIQAQMRDELILTKCGFVPNKFDNREKAS